MIGNYEFARILIDRIGKKEAYDLAISLLHFLGNERYCIWQTYSREDIKANMGIKHLEKDVIDNAQVALSNFFTDYYNGV